jgi:hypothetical protein
MRRALRRGLYAYPWDIADIGADIALGEMNAAGINALNLACTYHPIATFSPRVGARRMMYQELGGVFFPAQKDRYGRIKPATWSERKVLSAWAAAADAAEREGVKLNAWTIGMFQPWIAHSYPDCARVTAPGGVVYAGACPAAPDVRDYLSRLVGDVVSQFPVDTVMLELVGFPAFDYGWVRPRVLVPLGTWTQWLLSLCFCKNCLMNATAKGIDVVRLRFEVVKEIERSLLAAGEVDPTGSFEERHAEWLESRPDYAAFIQARDGAVVELLRSVSDAVRSESPATRLNIWSIKDVNLPLVLDLIDGITVGHGDRVEDVRRFKQSIDSGIDLDLQYLLLMAPQQGLQSQKVRSEMRVVSEIPVDQISLYNYGLLRQGQLMLFAEEMEALSEKGFAERPAPVRDSAQ